MENEKFTCFRLFYEIGKSIQDNETRLKYYDALMEYWLNWTKPTDPIINSLLVWPMYSIDKSTAIRTKKNDNISKSMKGNQNAVKNFEKVSKQLKTVWNSLEQIKTVKTDRSIEDNNIILNNNILTTTPQSDKKKEIKKLSIPSVNELVEAYELDTDLHGLFNQRWYTDEWAIEEWINYKQSWTKMTNWKKVSPYTSVRSCLTQLRKYAKVVSPDRLRPDIWPRFRLAVDKAIMKRDGIYWNDTYEKEYLDSKDLKQVEQDFTI